MANVTTSAETNVIKKADVTSIREKDFVLRFQGGIKKLIEILGITRKEEKEAGADLYTTKAVGTLESGSVAEGEIIPLSHYETEKTKIDEIELKKWRKATTAEAIIKGGYDQSVNKTNTKMLRQIQAGIKSELIAFLAEGTGVAAGETFQKTLAKMWAVLSALFEEDDVESVYFMNQLDVADYLASANITLQTAFGMTYVENFLGLGTVFFNSQVPKGEIYGTAKENLVIYYVNAATGELAKVFKFTTDETGFIGIHEIANYDRMQSETVAVSGLRIFAERLDGVVVGHIDATPTLGSLSVTSAAGTATGDTALTVSPAKASGNVYKYKVGTAAETVTYGQNVKNWTTWDGTSDITAATGKVLTLVEADAQYHAQAEGHATVTAKS